MTVSIKVSKLYPCLFFSKRVTAVAFVDSFWYTNEAYINEFSMKEHELLLEQEDDAAGYLGVQMSNTAKGFLEIKQSGLIDHVLEHWDQNWPQISGHSMKLSPWSRMKGVSLHKYPSVMPSW